MAARYGARDARQSIVNSSGKRVISRGRKAINPSFWAGTASMRHCILPPLTGKAGKTSYVLQLRKLRLWEVADLPRGTRLVGEGARTKSQSPGTTFSCGHTVPTPSSQTLRLTLSVLRDPTLGRSLIMSSGSNGLTLRSMLRCRTCSKCFTRCERTSANLSFQQLPGSLGNNRVLC